VPSRPRSSVVCTHRFFLVVKGTKAIRVVDMSYPLAAPLLVIFVIHALYL
jgi:hypothetical protein